MPGLSVYIHFPWCLRKCPYCDFATSPLERASIPHVAYADAVLRELEARQATWGALPLVSIFFGGGTPSLWEPTQIGRIARAIRAAVPAAGSDVEITVECNPSSLDEARAAKLRDEGVNRLSLGVQSLDDSELAFLGRLHDRTRALEALNAALQSHERVSADLMFGLPQQRPERFYAHVATLLDAGLTHVSAYALTIEPATPFGQRARKGLLQPAPDDTYAATFEGNRQLFSERGLAHYEVSNFAIPGEESRHNQHYWRGGSYLGLGAAAVGCLPWEGIRRRYRNHPDPARYMKRAGEASVEVFAEELGPQDIIREAFMLGLRTAEGVDLAQLERATGVDPREGRHRELARHVAAGNALLEGERLTIPAHRWLMLDGIVADFF